jgi:hypothetical protein
MLLKLFNKKEKEGDLTKSIMKIHGSGYAPNISFKCKRQKLIEFEK